jgi:hypothetical protein
MEKVRVDGSQIDKIRILFASANFGFRFQQKREIIFQECTTNDSQD